MALGTQRLEIIPVVCAPLGQLHLVVDNDSGSEPGFALAHLAQWMGRDIDGTDLFPSASVILVTPAVAAIPVVMYSLGLGMLRAVPSVHQVWASMMNTGLPGFIGHRHSSVQSKSPRRFRAEGF